MLRDILMMIRKHEFYIFSMLIKVPFKEKTTSLAYSAVIMCSIMLMCNIRELELGPAGE